MSSTNYEISCILGFEGDDERPFIVQTLSTTKIALLKNSIKAELKNDVFAKDLFLWKVCFSDYF
jgi:hypothetical protein